MNMDENQRELKANPMTDARREVED